MVTGSAGEVGGELTSNPIVRKLTFTGSTEIGRQLMAECAQDIKKVSLELGGNAPFIVFDDADLDAAVEGALISKYRNNGQTCVCANRLYVQDGVYDAFVDKLKAAVAKLNIGNGLEAGVTTGPLIDAKAVAKVEEHIADAVSKGAKVVSGGKPHALGGTFFEPTILVDVPKNALVSKDETFGPLAPVFRFKDEAEVIAMSNDTEFGLASYFYARDLARVFRVAEQLEYGMVGINTGLISNEVAPFGGIKASGLGREGSKYGIEDSSRSSTSAWAVSEPGEERIRRGRTAGKSCAVRCRRCRWWHRTNRESRSPIAKRLRALAGLQVPRQSIIVCCLGELPSRLHPLTRPTR